jgi:hypothetical protein
MTKDSKKRSNKTETENEKKLALTKLSAKIFKKELTDEEFAYWKQLLNPYPVEACEFAFENWNRNGGGFPNPSAILNLISAWHQTARNPQFVACGRDGCVGGFRLVYTGRTAGGNPVDSHYGAAVRCQCWLDFLAGNGLKPPERPTDGYGQNDIRLLGKLIAETHAKMKKRGVDRRLTDNELGGLLSTLDVMTGRAKGSEDND